MTSRATVLRLLAFFMIILSLFGSVGSTPGSAAPAASPPHVFPTFSLQQTRVIDLDVAEDTWSQFTLREKLEQVRDWLVFTVVTEAGLPPAEVNKILSGLPVVRADEMQSVGQFEYGATRSRHLGAGRVVALLPASRSAERLDHLAHIVDEQRKILGHRPHWLQVFEYTIDLAARTASLTHQEDVPADDLFTPAAGYYEMPIRTLDDLQRFLGQIDMLTFAKRHEAHLTLGGRKLQSHAYRGIQVTHIATLWQAMQQSQQQRRAFAEFVQAWNAKSQDFEPWGIEATRFKDLIAKNRLLVLATQRDLPSVADIVARLTQALALTRAEQALVAQHTSELLALLQQRTVDALTWRQADRLGFSLDPTYDYEGLYKVFVEQLAAALEVFASPPFTQETLRTVKDSLAQRQVGPFLRLAATLRASANIDVRTFGHELFEASERYSVAHVYNYQGLLRVFKELERDLRALLTPPFTLQRLEEVTQALTSAQTIVPYLALAHDLRTHESALARLWGDVLYKEAQADGLLDERGTPLSVSPTTYAVFAQHFTQDLAPQLHVLAVPPFTAAELDQVEAELTQRRIRAYVDFAATLRASANMDVWALGSRLRRASERSSLTREYDYARLARVFARLEPQLYALLDPLTTREVLDQVSQGLAQRNAVPYRKVTALLLKSKHPLARSWGADLLDIGDAYQFQTARYDGDLQGTEVGMILFYTDLLAKLWKYDHANSAPLQAIEGFKINANVRLAPFYAHELDEKPETRLWFGPDANGFQSANKGDSLFFGYKTTRLYAASLNPLTPDEETTANAVNAAIIGWWNNHYAEVARYEQEYERLNELMRWSLVLSWLYHHNQGDLFGYLQPVAVERSHWFPEWVRTQPQLKFQPWETVQFYAKGDKGSPTEALPLLYSRPFTLAGAQWHVSGGVALNTPTRWAAPLSPPAPPPGALSSPAEDQALLQIPQTALQGSTVAQAQAEYQRLIHYLAPGDRQISTQVNGHLQTSLHSTHTANNRGSITVRNEQAPGLELARKASTRREFTSVLRGEPRLEAVIEDPQGVVHVTILGTTLWMSMTPADKVSPPTGATIRVADPDGKQTIAVEWRDAEALLKHLPAGGVIVWSEVAKTTGIPLVQYAPRGPPTPDDRPLTVTDRAGTTLTGYVDAAGRIALDWHSLPPHLQTDPRRWPTLLTAQDRDRIRGLRASSPSDAIEYTVASPLQWVDAQSPAARTPEYLLRRLLDMTDRADKLAASGNAVTAALFVQRTITDLVPGQLDPALPDATRHSLLSALTYGAQLEWRYKHPLGQIGRGELVLDSEQRLRPVFHLTNPVRGPPEQDLNALNSDTAPLYAQVVTPALLAQYRGPASAAGVVDFVMNANLGTIIRLPSEPLALFPPDEIVAPQNVRFQRVGVPTTPAAQAVYVICAFYNAVQQMCEPAASTYDTKKP